MATEAQALAEHISNALKNIPEHPTARVIIVVEDDDDNNFAIVSYGPKPTKERDRDILELSVLARAANSIWRKMSKRTQRKAQRVLSAERNRSTHSVSAHSER